MAGGWLSRKMIRDNAVSQDKLDVSVDQTVSVQLTTAQILALNATPITLVSAPGAGKAIIFLGAYCLLDYNSAAYGGIATGEDIAVRYTGSSGEIVGRAEATGWLDATADGVRWINAFSAYDSQSDVTPAVNAALVAHMTAGEVTTGNSPINIDIYYRILKTPTGS